MAENSKETLNITPLAQLLLEIAHHLSENELSEMKLLLEVSGHIRQREGDSLRNPADLLKFMFHKRLVCDENLALITETLGHIHRLDCVKKIQKYEEKRRSDVPMEDDLGQCGEIILRRSRGHLTLEEETEAVVTRRPCSSIEYCDCYQTDTISNHSDEEKIRRNSSFI